MEVTRRLVEFAIDTEYQDIPREVIDNAKRSILDCLGVTLAASQHPIAKILDDYLMDVGGREQSTVIGLGFKTSCPNAAFANGTLGHLLDYDDQATPMVGHPTAPVLPAVLAVGELNNATGKEVLTAFAIGVEVELRIGDGAGVSNWYRGFHATGTLGTFGSVAASGKLLSLNSEEYLNAFGLAGSQASGLKHNFGTMTKPFHAGNAAEGGVRGALLAKKGFTAGKSIVEGKMGFCAVMADEYNLDRMTDRLGSRWDWVDPGIYIKPYPSCGGTHAMINATLSLAKEYNIDPNGVDLVEVGVHPGSIEQLIYSEPKTALEGKFSANFAVAVALLERKVGVKQVTDAKVRDTRTVELMRRIKMYIDEEISKTVPPEGVDDLARVKVKMKDGSQYSRVGELGVPPTPFLEKYRDCAGVLLSKAAIEKSVDLVMKLEKLNSIRNVIDLIANRGQRKEARQSV